MAQTEQISILASEDCKLNDSCKLYFGTAGSENSPSCGDAYMQWDGTDFDFVPTVNASVLNFGAASYSWSLKFLGTGTLFSIGSKASLKGSGVALEQTDDWGAVRVFTDDNGASVGKNVRALQSRTLLTYDQAGGSIRAIQGQVKWLAGIDSTTGVYTAIQGYNEFAGATSVQTGAVTSCFDASTELASGTAMTVDSGGRYAGVHVETTGTGTITNNGTCAAVLIDKASGAAAWPVGVQFSMADALIGVQATGLTTGNVFAFGTSSTAATTATTATHAFYTNMESSHAFGGVTRGVYATNLYANTGHCAATLAIAGKAGVKTGITWSTDGTSYVWGVQGQLDNTGATINQAGAIMAAMRGVITGSGTYTAYSHVACLFLETLNSGDIATGGEFSLLYMANDSGTGSSQTVDNGIYLYTPNVTNFVNFSGTGNGGCVTASTEAAQASTFKIKIKIGATTAYIPVIASGT